MSIKELEIWADSFHEGQWCCENIALIMKKFGFSVQQDYLHGFQPFFIMTKNDIKFQFVVYGSYKSWNNRPQKIDDLIEWGKPDFVIYDAQKDNLILAVEETAATTTGNQALQRCERQYGSSRFKIPYWYLLSEYSIHSDGGIRKDSIWPIVAAIKLSILNTTPCLVVHYSDENNLENYSAGKGFNLLFMSIAKLIINYVMDRFKYTDMEDLICEQYSDMLSFIAKQWDNIVDYMPDIDMINNKDTAKEITNYILNKTVVDKEKITNFLHWPCLSELPIDIRNKQKGAPLLKYDCLMELLENDVTQKKAYTLSNNAGSGKPCCTSQIISYINAQKNKFNSSSLQPEAKFSLKVEDFPKTKNGNHHITTAKNIVYLYDQWGDLEKSITIAYPRLKGKFNFPDNIPVFVYISNSLTLGRVFGDPFTGQLAAYATAFGHFDNKKRIVIAYFPHQVHSQINPRRMNKGLTLMKELTDIIIFHGGVAVNLSKGEIL